MSLESITSGAAHTIADLDEANPAAGDDISQGDDHLRNIKHALHLTFPNISATVCGVAAELALAHAGGSVSGALMVKDTLTVSGATALKGALSVGGALDVAGTLSVGGQVAFKDTVSLSSNAVIGGTLTVGGAAQIDGNLSVSGGVRAGSLSVSGNSIMRGSLTVSANTVVEGMLSVIGATTLQGTLTVGGATHLQGALSVGGAVTTNSDMDVGGYMYATGGVRAGGALTANSTLVAHGEATFNNAVSVSGAVNILGAAAFNGAVTMQSLDVAATISGSCVQAGYARSAGAVSNSQVFSSGTRVVFQQTVAPSGWSKETQGTYDNRALRLVTGTVGSGGSTAFTTLFTSSRASSSSGDHTHGNAVGTPTVLDDLQVGSGEQVAATNHSHTVTIYSAGAHTHTVDLAVTYTDVVICQRN